MERKTQKGRYQLISMVVAGKPYFEIREMGGKVFHTSYLSVILMWVERKGVEMTQEGSRMVLEPKSKVAA